MGTPDRVAALSEQLVIVHQDLRERLAALRQEAAMSTARTAPAPASAPDPGSPEHLLSHCLGFCAAIGTHHAGEDGQLLPALRAAVPELTPVIDRLIEDHQLVVVILQRVRELLAPGHAPSALGALVRELDGLTAILESHFGYEERRIARALDALGPQAWAADVFTAG